MSDPKPNYTGKGVVAIDVLDHGFVALRNLSGPTRRPEELFDASDVDPANSARMSFENMDSGRSEEDDHRLAKYLMRHWHTTPFEMIECWIEMKMPIFVARQFVRHRTATINEVSGRYITLPEEWYIPEIVGAAAKDKKQGQAEGLAQGIQDEFKHRLDAHCQQSYFQYTAAIRERVAPEHARMFLHLNHYTHWLWKQDLHNIMHFLALRRDSHAQIEAQKYAEAILGMLRKHLPHSMALFDEYRRNG